METPLFFYKFVSFERKDILENGLIRFTPAKYFNDPFELTPTITPFSTQFIEYSSGLNEIELPRLYFNEEDDKYSYYRESQIEIYRAKFKNEVEKYGILSLSSNNKINQLLTVSIPEKDDPRTNLLMWSHYADSHKGFVIEFESDFVEGIDIKHVNYSENRHVLTFEDIEENRFDSIFFRKSDEWSYEQEYRAVLPLDKADKTDDNDVHLFKIKEEKMRGITFGASMLDENKLIIMDIIKKNSKYTNVKFNHARLNDNGYMLDFYYDDGRCTNNPIYGGRRIRTQRKF